MTTIERALLVFPETAAPEWREVNGAAVHKDCVVTEAAKFAGPAVCRRGVFHGGVFHGGWFHDGVFRGGWFHGGVFRGGVFHGKPCQLFGFCDYAVTIGRPGQVAVGCECHTPADWRANIAAIAAKHGVNEAEQARVLRAVTIAEEWLVANPNVVTEAK